MKKKFLKKVIAQSEKDLQFISACCSDGIVNINGIKFLPKNKIFLLFIDRFVAVKTVSRSRRNALAHR